MPDGAAPGGLRPLLLSLGLCGALLIGAFAGQAALVVAVVAAQALLAYGWYAVIDVPGRVAGAAIVLAAGVAGDVAMLARDPDPSLGPLAGVLALAAIAAVVHQLARTDGRDRITASLTATMGAAALSVLAAAVVAARDAIEGQAVTVVVALAAGGATVAASVPLAAARFEPTVFAVGFVQGLVGGAIVGDLAGRDAAVIAAVAAALAVAGRRTAEYMAYDAARARAAGAAAAGADGGGAQPRPDRAVRRAAAHQARRPAGGGLVLGSTLPVLLAAPAAYVLGRLLVG